MAARDTILTTIREKLRETPGVTVVTRSLRKAFAINEMPSVTLMDLGDTVDEKPSGPAMERTTHIRLSILYHGSTEEKAPEELGLLADEVRGVMVSTELAQALDPNLRARVFEIDVSELSCPKETSARIVEQQISFDILYVVDARI